MTQESPVNRLERRYNSRKENEENLGRSGKRGDHT
jgi:hypothetical protein